MNNFREKLSSILNVFSSIEEQLMSPDLPVSKMTELMKERAEMLDISDAIKELEAKEADIAAILDMLNDQSCDNETRMEMEVEVDKNKREIPQLERKIKLLLLPKDDADSKSAILEIRQGAGGDEAGLFGLEMMDMYRKFSEKNSWRFEQISMTYNAAGGLKEGIFSVSGKNVFAKFKFESGTHRVQRVPKTESGGRLHTSTVTIAVLPEAEDINLDIKESDLRIDVFRSSGPGGQSVNTTDSAVRITHLPTGITVSQQDEKSQIKNREKARKILFARIYEAERNKKNEEMSSHKRSQIGSGDRSEKVRTYNFPQDRITDHRINKNFHNVESIVQNGDIDEMVDSLIEKEESDRLASGNFSDT